MGRRAVLSTAGSLFLAGTAGAEATADAASAGRGRRMRTGFATFEWLGTSGWRIVTPTTTLLVDPYLSRFETGLAAGRFNATTPLTLDTTAIDAALGAPGTDRGSVDAILVTHTHWDHFADVPHIAASRDATVFTTSAATTSVSRWGYQPLTSRSSKGARNCASAMPWCG